MGGKPDANVLFAERYESGLYKGLKIYSSLPNSSLYPLQHSSD